MTFVRHEAENYRYCATSRLADVIPSLFEFHSFIHSTLTMIRMLEPLPQQSPPHDSHQHQPVDDVVRLFRTTLQSLAADAAAVRQVTCLAQVLEDNDNGNDNGNDNDNDNDVQQSLQDLEAFVTGLEDKATALRQLVREEKRALVQFETTLAIQANEQALLVEQMEQVLKVEVEIETTTTAQEETTRTEEEEEDDEYATRRHGSRRDSVDPRRSADNHENVDPLAHIAVSRIAPQEWDDFQARHNTPGPRITTSLMDLNVALEEIEQVCQRQRHAALVLKRKQEQLLQGSTGSLGAWQRRYDYLQKRQQLQHGPSTIVTATATATATIPGHHHHHHEDADDPVVSITEQELREACAFFRHGESTARMTLSLLCRLKRLKQVPNKTGQVTYHLI